MDISSIWNIQPPLQSTSLNALTISKVKAEPFLSPNYYGGSYRCTNLTTPSQPQPTSPMMNRIVNTPPPRLVRNSSAESQTQMSNLYNQSQMRQEQLQSFTNNFEISTTITCTHTSDAEGANEYNNSNLLHNTTNTLYNNNNFNTSNSQQQKQFATTNICVNRTSGGSFTPIYTDDNSNKANIIANSAYNNIELQTMNVTNNVQQVPAVFATTNNICNPFQDANTITDPSLLNLSQLDDLVPLQNSDELRISNLSIST